MPAPIRSAAPSKSMFFISHDKRSNSMNRYSIFPAILICLSGAATPVLAEETMQIFDNGLDGEVRYYSVVCPSGKRTSVSNDFENKQICTTLVNDKEKVCREGWDVDSAAKEACQ
jgi:hypothetical protein